MLKETPLYSIHKNQGAKFIPFSGWKLPLQFSSAQKEHLNVRNNVGLFDISHMGEILIQGPKALNILSKVLTNNIKKIENKQCLYSLICNEEGGILDDVIVYCLERPSEYLLCVNATNTSKIFNWLKKNSTTTPVENVSSKWGQIALQGPNALTLLKEVFAKENSLASITKSIQRFRFEYLKFQSQNYIVSRTGYTGEDGFEILCPWNWTTVLWEAFLKTGAFPCGLSSRDTLRLEMKYPLYGQDMDEKITPYEMGLTWACKNPLPFIGKEKALKESSRKWIGFEVIEESGIPRHNYNIFKKDQKIGEVTSGVLSPSLQKMIGLALIKKEFSSLGTIFFIEIHNKNVPAKVVSTPFLKKTST